MNNKLYSSFNLESHYIFHNIETFLTRSQIYLIGEHKKRVFQRSSFTSLSLLELL